jgi:hypothetical protein
MVEEPNQRDTFPASTPLMGNEEGSREEVQASPSGQEKPGRIPPSDTVRRSWHVVYLTLFYAAIAIFAWVVVCTLAYHPVGATSYTSVTQYYTTFNPDAPYSYNASFGIFAQSERYLTAARVLQSVASALTIPLTSTVCSCAAVGFLQRRRQGGPTLRQSMVLADRGWSDPVLIAKLVAGGWKRYGSRFLLSAIVLNLLGKGIPEPTSCLKFGVRLPVDWLAD